MQDHFVLVMPHVFLASTVLLAASIDWPRRWLLSGAPLLTYAWFVGAANGHRVLPFVSLWTLVSTLNLMYAVAATSWLLYWIFIAACYPVILASCLFQFHVVSNTARKLLRSALKQIHFIDDKIAFFDLPALEIDTDVDGLMVIRGISVSLSTLTIVAHGVEVCIKLADDMELALRTADVTISLLRKIEIGHVYGNLKGGSHEMSFGSLAEATETEDSDLLVVEDTPILRMAAENAPHSSQQKQKIMAEKLINNVATEQESARKGLQSTRTLYLVDQDASDKYKEKLRWIDESSAIEKCQKAVDNSVANSKKLNADSAVNSHENDSLAAICSQLHSEPSISNPPPNSLKVTTLQGLIPLYLRKFLHRLPLLYRLLLNPLSYFHPITIDSITMTASGAWIQCKFDQTIFPDSTQSSTDTKSLESSVSSWLSNANFALSLSRISASAHVPLLPGFYISSRMIFDDVMAYRVLPDETDWKRVIQLGGADASVEIPSFLLPHHEHLLPPRPNIQVEQEQEAVIGQAKGKPKIFQAQKDLDQIRRDETNMKISVHARLPLVLDQELLDFALALVKASKLVEMEKNPSPLDDEVHGFKDFSKAVGLSIRGGLGKTVIDNFTNDKWVAKFIGKVIQKLEMARGDIGYSGDVPISLTPYRDQTESESKILV